MHKTQRMFSRVVRKTRGRCFCCLCVPLTCQSDLLSSGRSCDAEAASEQQEEQKYALCLRLKNKHQAWTHLFSSSSLELTWNSVATGLQSLSSVIFYFILLNQANPSNQKHVTPKPIHVGGLFAFSYFFNRLEATTFPGQMFLSMDQHIKLVYWKLIRQVCALEGFRTQKKSSLYVFYLALFSQIVLIRVSEGNK